MKNPAYIGCYFKITPLQPASEILIAELEEKGFESFVETETGVEAFIQKEGWKEDLLDQIFILNSNEFQISYTVQEIEQVNWNKEWEQNFKPIVVEDLCAVRAPFHDPISLKYEIIIEPKMSFGTGHHETTYMMIQYILNYDFTQKKVLDMGCGTGILAILAGKKGASPIDAIDIDEWCYLNTKENIEKNKCYQISVYQGDVSLLTDQKYDVIIANINRNILLNDIAAYTKTLPTGGSLFLSGFYKQDLEIIDAECQKNGLKRKDFLERNNWIAAHYELKKCEVF